MRDKNALLIPLVAVALVVLLPVILPLVAVLVALDQHRLRKAAATFACLTCGRLLGPDALDLADQTWTDDAQTDDIVAARAHPGIRLRSVRTVHAVCPRCETRYTFLRAERTFVPEGQPEHDASDPTDAYSTTRQE